MISGRVSDLHMRIHTQRNPDVAPNPERRLRLQIPGIFLSLTGVLLYGWFCEFHINVVGVIVASALGTLPLLYLNFRFSVIFPNVLSNLFSQPSASFNKT